MRVCSKDRLASQGLEYEIISYFNLLELYIIDEISGHRGVKEYTNTCLLDVFLAIIMSSNATAIGMVSSPQAALGHPSTHRQQLMSRIHRSLET